MKPNKTNQGIIPYDYIVTKEQPNSYITEAYQKLIANIEFMNVDGLYKIIQVTSSIMGEGKTTFLMNFGYLMGLRNKKVLILDLDLRRPKVHRALKVMNENGVTNFLKGDVALDQSIHHYESLKVDAMVAGEKTSAVVNLLESEKLKQLIHSLKDEYDYILVDSPPVLNVADAMYISKLVDGVIFIVAQKISKKNMVKESIQTLRQNNVPILGIAVVQVDYKDQPYGYQYGYQYGYGYGYYEYKED
jgi:protein-tyrosine kinase